MPSFISDLSRHLKGHAEIKELVRNALVDQPPLLLSDGGFIRQVSRLIAQVPEFVAIGLQRRA